MGESHLRTAALPTSPSPSLTRRVPSLSPQKRAERAKLQGAMTLALIGVGASYVVIAALLLSLNLASLWHWGVKAAAITVTTGFFGVSFASITGLIGWPSQARVPEHFQLHWATVVEPDKLNGLLGSIYLWVESLDESNMPAGIPRAFRVPYSRELADRIVRAKERIEQGMDQAGTARDLEVREGPPDEDRRLAGTPPRRDEPGSAGDPTAFIQHMPSIEFEDMPPPVLPSKRPL